MDKKGIALFLLPIFLFALAIRLIPYNRIFDGGYTYFIDPDSYYHMRGIIYTVQHFPAGLLYDSYVNYPDGFGNIWSPFFDQIIAFFSLIAGFGHPSISLIETVGAYFPAIIGALTVIPVYFLVRNIFDEYAGMFSAFLIAIMSAHIFQTLFGYTDYQGLNSFLALMIYIFFILALKKSKEYRTYSLLAGILSGVALYAWAGTPIYLSLIGIYGILQSIINQRKKETSLYLANIGIIMFLSALLTAGLLIIAAYGSLERSLTQLLLTAVLLAEFILIGLLSNIIMKRRLDWKIYPVIFAAVAVFFAAIMASFFPQMLMWMPYITKQTSCYLTTIEQTQSLFAVGDNFFEASWNLFHYTFFTAFIGLAMMVHRYLKDFKSRSSSSDLFVFLWFIQTLILSFYQVRFTIELAFPVAALNGFLFSTVKEFVKTISFEETGELYNQIFRYILMGVFIISITASSISDIKAINDEPYLDPMDYYETWTWLRDNTPNTSYYAEPTQRPEYGIMNWWSYGNGIIYYGERAAISNNFQTGIFESSKFFSETDENNASDLEEKRKARYIFSTPLDHGRFRDMLIIASDCTKNESSYRDFPFDSYYRSMLFRLHLADGRGLTRHRLVYESGNTEIMDGYSVKQAKVFEFVNGTVITGSAPAGEIDLSVKIRTNRGRSFWYNQTAVSQGSYAFTVPYSMDAPYETRAVAPYIISINNITRTVNVSEQDIMQGKRVTVDMNHEKISEI